MTWEQHVSSREAKFWAFLYTTHMKSERHSASCERIFSVLVNQIFHIWLPPEENYSPMWWLPACEPNIPTKATLVWLHQWLSLWSLRTTTVRPRRIFSSTAHQSFFVWRVLHDIKYPAIIDIVGLYIICSPCGLKPFSTIIIWTPETTKTKLYSKTKQVGYNYCHYRRPHYYGIPNWQ